MAPNFIVFQAYGSKDILHEMLVSISSILRFDLAMSPQIIVYTDSRSYLEKWLPSSIIYIDTPNERWEEWKGTQHFVHRAKIQMLRDFATRFEGNVLYCDTDTYFLQSPEPLFLQIANGELLMHVDEGPLKDSENLVFKKLVKFLKVHKTEYIPVDTHMWNAGVLGFQTSDVNLLDRALVMSDDLYKSYPKHVMEQLAFSFVFQSKKRRSCEETIFHYWDFKEYRSVLATFFKESEGQSYAVWSTKLAGILPMDLRDTLKAPKRLPLWRRIFK